MKILIAGGGSFGTVMGVLVAPKVQDVVYLVRDPRTAEAINADRRNERYLADHVLPANVRATVDPAEAGDADVAFLAVPSHTIAAVASVLAPHVGPDTLVINLAKGLADRHFTLDKLLAEHFQDSRIGALKGPTFVRPLIHGARSGMTLAMADATRAPTVAALFDGSPITIETWGRVCDIEFLGALKNVYAIAMGLCDALEDNPNTRFFLITDIVKEMRLVLTDLGFDAQVLFTYAGLGDVLMTALSSASRNHTLGFLMGRNFSLSDREQGPVLEGMTSVRVILERCGGATAYPILGGLGRTFARETSPTAFFDRITNRHPRDCS